ncbi:hypothetical protein D0Z07_2067 [Hyphodiscus hymeniophilus]|uniref:Rap1 Myb domain-containing protein n=1 Tax=Hyphodiscus hymeniophilus TaxID=353542 RepID=A0A9P6VQE6_9HELO|nr:hypothetical protein D0Z07_2067 [Hyphodiscus hymeniophilus]
MDRPAKRPRYLLTSRDNVYSANYNSQHEYYEIPDNEVNSYEEPEQETEEEIYDPDQELQLKRAQADFKLKSTFEAIFEKYGKDFGGIGDEIDMRTGEIMVNNGHLISMRHEADAGEIESQLSEELYDDMSGFVEQDLEDEDEEDEDQNTEEEEDGLEDEGEDGEDFDDEDVFSDEEMVEDDMILRGFAQASQQFINRRQPQEPGPSITEFAARAEPQRTAVVRPSLPKSSLPSRSEILAQFGPQLGPEIAKYVSERGAPKDSDIEAAWQVPDIGSFRRAPNIEPAWRIPDLEPNSPPTPGRRPIIKSMVIRPELEIERSASPKDAPSIWATTAWKTSRRSASRQRFQPHEDQLLLDFVADARRQGLDLGKMSTWKLLEAMNPRRDHKSWKQRYNTKFTYLRPNPHEESDLSTSEASSSTAQLHDQCLSYGMSIPRPVPLPAQLNHAQRPARARKPAQRDGIVTWSDAIATIASVDPIGNAGLLDDVRRTGNLTTHGVPVSSMFAKRHSLDKLARRRPVDQNPSYQTRPERQTESLSGAEDDPILNDSAYGTEEQLPEKAPCPHADCKLYPTTLYRVERGLDEELSPMCSHLLYEHHITPFPCGEVNCERKGARGYFMQRHLVEHVRDAHPYAAALHRLRGRVDSALLHQNHLLDQPRETIEADHRAPSGKQPRDSDFMIPQRPYIRRQCMSTHRQEVFAVYQSSTIEKHLLLRTFKYWMGILS